ncbi:MAG: hypothetical protein LBU76_00440 [Azoarcus sp.]|jgi:uncharacterized protein involved in type VI secretion and phage assembly|nr:hypothetical protein [Azoarcus sp.]
MRCISSPSWQKARTGQATKGLRFGGRLLAQELEGEEALSACYKYEVAYLSPDAFIPLDDLLGLDAQIGLLTVKPLSKGMDALPI